MLNLGQAVYDTTNKRVLIFGGVEMLQNQETGKCHTVINFLTEDMEELRYGKDEERPFKYRNFDPVEGEIPVGKFFVGVADLLGHYFGNVDFNLALQITEMEDAAKETFEEAKEWSIPTKPKS